MIVPATDRPPTLERAVEAIRASSLPPDELIVVAELAGDGPAAARNAGAARASAPVLVFVDADVLVHPDALARIANAFGADPELTAVFGAYDDRPPAPGVVSRFRNLLHHHVHTANAGRVDSFWAGLGGIRRDAFDVAGGFDASRYGESSIEDVELGARLAASGARVVLDPEIRGTHLKRWTLGAIARTDFARRGVPWVELLARGEAPVDQLNLGWRHRLSALASLAALAALLARRPAPLAGALAALAALNRGFYVLLWRRGGPAQVAAGIPLHVVHHLTSVAAVAVGLARVGRRRG